MKVQSTFAEKFKYHERQLLVYLTIDDEKNIKEISAEAHKLQMAGIQETAWISKKQAKKLDQFPRPPMTGKLLSGNFSIRIYTH